MSVLLLELNVPSKEAQAAPAVVQDHSSSQSPQTKTDIPLLFLQGFAESWQHNQNEPNAQSHEAKDSRCLHWFIYQK